MTLDNDPSPVSSESEEVHAACGELSSETESAQEGADA